MIVLEGHFDEWRVPAPTAVTIGVYDGIHLGHQHVIARTRDGAGDALVAVLTFDGHPLSLSAPDHAPQLLTNRTQKLELLEGLGVDVVGLLQFDEALRHLPPSRFVEEVLVDVLRASRIVVGRDFRFGYERAGDVDLLVREGERHGFVVDPVDLVGGAVPVSSTAVRQVIDAGDVEAARRMLGRRFELMGTVVPGDGRGRTIGFPTANLAIPPSILLPRQGVYAVQVVHGESLLDGVVNIGVRPTFGPGRETVEVHVLDYDGDLYGDELRLRFVARMRGEQRFSSVDDLIARIEADVARAGQILAGTVETTEPL